MKNNTMQYRNPLACLGIVLAIDGIGCMAVVKGLLDYNIRELSIGVVIGAVLLMATGQCCTQIQKTTWQIRLIGLYSLATLVLAFFSGIGLMESGSGFVYQGAYFVEIILLWNMRRDGNLENYVKIGFWVSGVFCIIELALLMVRGCVPYFNNFYSLHKNVNMVDMGTRIFPPLFNTFYDSSFVNPFDKMAKSWLFTEILFDREATGTLAYATFVFAVAYRANKKPTRICKYIVLLSSVAAIAVSSRRSIYMAVVLTLILHGKNMHVMAWVRSHKRLTAILVSGGVVLLTWASISVPIIRDLIMVVVTKFWNGLITMLGLSKADASASMRFESASLAWNSYKESTMLQFLFGRGYMHSWVDMPFFQAFIDLGVFGGIVFSIIMFVVPLKYLWKKTNSAAVMAAQYFTVLSMIEGLFNSFPYGKFFSIVLLLMVSDWENKKMEVAL